MHFAASNLLRLAADIESTNPLLAYELSKRVHGLVAVINPETERFEQKVERILSVLKSMKQELEKAKTDYDTAEEFAKFFKEGLPEEDELRRLVSSSIAILASQRVALPDWLKRKKKPEKKEEKDEESSGLSPSYKMSPADQDAFVEGKGEFDSGKAIEKERGENERFMKSVEEVTKMFDKFKKRKPKDLGGSKNILNILLKAVTNLISSGTKLIEGWDAGQKKKSKPKPKQKSGPIVDLSDKVQHYVDLLQKNMGDEAKTMSTLKEFFKAVKPVVEDERAVLSSALPALIKTAHTHARTRKVLLPLIQRIAARS